MRTCCLAALALLLSGCAAAGDRDDGRWSAAEQADLASIQQLVELTYGASSFPDIATSGPEAFRAPFTSNATLGYVADSGMVLLSVDNYVEIRVGMRARGEPQSLVEWEVDGATGLFGDVAHRVSLYAVRVNGSEEPVERGVMRFQMVRIAGEWKVQSLRWDAESDALPLPVRYLGDGGS